MPSSPEYWEDRATDLSRTSLDTIRASAAAWAATTTALLGVFGTVAVVAGPASIDDLHGGAKDGVAALVIAAAVFAFISVLATGYATRGPTKKYSPLTGLRLKKWTSETASRANSALTVGRVAGIAAAVMVLAAGIVATVAAAAKSSSPSPASYLVRTTDGSLQCGVLKRSTTTLLLVDESGHTLLDLSSGIESAAQVASCPSRGAK